MSLQHSDEELDAFLEHHGILGMHWGKRNGPPYPLDSSKSNGERLLKSGGSGKTEKKKAKNTASETVKSEPESHDDSPDEVKRMNAIKKQAKKNINELTDDEIKDLRARLDLEASVKDFTNPPQPKKKSALEKVADKVGPLSDIVAKGVAIITAMNKVKDAQSESKKKAADAAKAQSDATKAATEARKSVAQEEDDNRKNRAEADKAEEDRGKAANDRRKSSAEADSSEDKRDWAREDRKNDSSKSDDNRRDNRNDDYSDDYFREVPPKSPNPSSGGGNSESTTKKKDHTHAAEAAALAFLIGSKVLATKVGGGTEVVDTITRSDATKLLDAIGPWVGTAVTAASTAAALSSPAASSLLSTTVGSTPLLNAPVSQFLLEDFSRR